MRRQWCEAHLEKAISLELFKEFRCIIHQINDSNLLFHIGSIDI